MQAQVRVNATIWKCWKFPCVCICFALGHACNVSATCQMLLHACNCIKCTCITPEHIVHSEFNIGWGITQVFIAGHAVAWKWRP